MRSRGQENFDQSAAPETVEDVRQTPESPAGFGKSIEQFLAKRGTIPGERFGSHPEAKPDVQGIGQVPLSVRSNADSPYQNPRGQENYGDICTAPTATSRGSGDRSGRRLQDRGLARVDQIQLADPLPEGMVYADDLARETGADYRGLIQRAKMNRVNSGLRQLPDERWIVNTRFAELVRDEAARGSTGQA